MVLMGGSLKCRCIFKGEITKRLVYPVLLHAVFLIRNMNNENIFHRKLYHICFYHYSNAVITVLRYIYACYETHSSLVECSNVHRGFLLQAYRRHARWGAKRSRDFA